jgi:hypothetical protein
MKQTFDHFSMQDRQDAQDRSQHVNPHRSGMADPRTWERLIGHTNHFEREVARDPFIGTQYHAIEAARLARSNDNRPGGRDLIGHSSVQAWSAGPLFPAIIYVRERYDDQPYDAMGGTRHLDDRLRSRSFVLSLDGREEEYASHADAEQVARALLESPRLRARWNQNEDFSDDAEVGYNREAGFHG